MYLEERMAYCGVPLHCNGQSEVDRASEADLGQGEEDWDQVLVQAAGTKAAENIHRNNKILVKFEIR